jgi:hypothetical protein
MPAAMRASAMSWSAAEKLGYVRAVLAAGDMPSEVMTNGVWSP